MAQNDIWKDIFDQKVIEDIQATLNRVSQLCDKQCFGMVRPEITDRIKAELVVVRRKIDNFEAMLPKSQVVGTIDVHVAFVKDINKLLERQHGSNK